MIIQVELIEVTSFIRTYGLDAAFDMIDQSKIEMLAIELFSHVCHANSLLRNLSQHFITVIIGVETVLLQLFLAVLYR